MPEDRWAHRSATMWCATCIYFVPKLVKATVDPGRTGPIEIESQPSKLGRCRRHAPTLGGWPAVYLDDWCGDHKLDETKL